ETGVVPVLSHHDTNPIVGQRETRQRPQRVSGGGIFSIADAPIHCERPSTEEPAVSFVVPTLWKVCEMPAALRVRLDWHPKTKPEAGARLTATPLAAGTVEAVALHERLVAFVRDHPNTSGAQIASSLHVNRNDTYAALHAL